MRRRQFLPSCIFLTREKPAKRGFSLGAGIALDSVMPPLDIFRHYDTVQFLRQHETARLSAHQAARAAKSEEAAAATPASETTLGSTFEDILDIVNPLQHLPVVGTLYRAVTGDKMDTLPKIAGDTLYGGLWGAVSSLADTAFEAITGKDFGSTVLAMVTNGLGIGQAEKPVQLAAAQTAKPQSAAQQGVADEMAFSSALAAKGVDSALSARALYAYRRSQGMADAAAGLN
jgi:hypothetical protein